MASVVAEHWTFEKNDAQTIETKSMMKIREDALVAIHSEIPTVITAEKKPSTSDMVLELSLGLDDSEVQ